MAIPSTAISTLSNQLIASNPGNVGIQISSAISFAEDRLLTEVTLQNQALFDENARSVQANIDLQTAAFAYTESVDTEAISRDGFISGLVTDVSNAWQASMSTEVNTRSDADQALTASVVAEQTARASADTNISTLVTANTNKLNLLVDSGVAFDTISELITNYTLLDSNLNSALTATIGTKAATSYVDSQDSAISARVATLEIDPATSASVTTQEQRIDTILAGTHGDEDTFAEVYSVTQTNASGVSTNNSGVAANLVSVNTHTGQISSITADVGTNTSGISANTTKLSGSTQSEISALGGLDTSTSLETRLDTLSVRDTAEVWEANKTIKTTANLAFRVKSAANSVLFTCDTTDMEVQMSALVIDSDGLNLGVNKTLTYNGGTDVQVQLNTKQASLSVAQIAVCDGDVFPASSYSTTSVTNSTRATDLADYSTTSVLTGQLAAKQDNLSVAQLAVCDGDVFPASSYSTTSVTNSTRATALADYSTTSTLTGQLATKLNTTGNQTMTGKLYLGNEGGNGVTAYNSNTDDLVVLNWNDVGITIGAPQGKIGSLTFCDQNKADRNQIRAYSSVRDSRNIGMHHFGNQADSEVPTLSVCDTLVGINKAQPTVELDVVGSLNVSGNVELNGDELESSTYTVRLTNLPTSAGEASANGLWRDSSGYLRIKDA